MRSYRLWSAPHTSTGRAWLASIAVALAIVTVLAGTGSVSASVGTITQFPLPAANSYPGSITTGPDGALWFAESGKIGRISTTGALKEFSLPAGHNPASIRPGPDGALWFTEPTKSIIGRITTSGVITEQLVPGACPTGYNCVLSPRPQAITTGSDGNLWITETMFSSVAVRTTAAKVLRLTTSGTFTEFQLPSGGTKATTPTPGEIVNGSDGALWFTDAREGRIWRITTDGTLTWLTVPQGSPQSITRGGDGNLWFSAVFGTDGRIGRLTTGGVFTEFPVPGGTNGVGIGAITWGPDGNLWFTKYDMIWSNGIITRMTPTGALRNFPFATYDEIDGITGGPDNAVWFSVTNNQSGSSRIGRLATA